MPRRLTESQQARYLVDGVAFPVAVLSPLEVAHFRTACDALEGLFDRRPRTIDVRQMHLHFRWAYELATHPPLLDAVEDILGGELVIWATELFVKPPGDAAISVGWHRDEPYIGLASGRSTTAWVALSDSGPANGCMRALPRSADTPPADRRAGGPLLPPEREADLVDVALGPGEMSLHAPDVIHGSGPNRSGEKRVGFVVRFVTPDAVPAQGRPPVVAARGGAVADHFTVAAPPGPVPEAAAFAGLRASAAEHLDHVLENLKLARR
jgi:non-heme Fe2+,alpha-ketoglutarate-dependent halogenase